ncbi:MAG: hypothetical protein R2724_18865 [Bryobacterales bacterium]
MLILSALPGVAAELRLESVDMQGNPVWSRIEVRNSQGAMFQPQFPLRDKTARNVPMGGPWYVGSFVAQGEIKLDVPPGDYRVVSERGPEFNRLEVPVTVKDGVTAFVKLENERWIDMNEMGWFSGDFHVHRPPDDLPALLQAEGLNLGVVFTMWNKRDLFEGRKIPRNSALKVDPTHIYTVNNAEDERGGGAWMFHGLREKLGLAVDGRWYPPGVDFIQKAKAQRYVPTGMPWIDVEKPFWWEVPVVMALEQPDSLGLLHNHFNQYGVLANEAWGRARDEEKRPGASGFAESSLELNYRYWNLGFRVPASAGSASGVLPNPVGYNRIYVQLNEPFGVEPFYRELRQGKSFVTNGPMLFFEAFEQPGGSIRVLVDVRSRDPLDRVEVVANGVVIQTFGAPPGKRSFRTELSVAGGLYSWIAVRAFEQSADTVRMAHSQPYWVDAPFGVRSDAEFFINWIDELIRQTEQDEKRFANDREREAMLGLYRQAREVYEQKRAAFPR